MNLIKQPTKLFAAALVLAVAGTFALTALAQPAAGEHRQGRHGAGEGGMMMGGPGAAMHLSERVLDRVNASAEQRAQIKQIMQGASTDLKASHEGRRAQREQMMQIFTQPNVDARAAEALRQQMSAQHEQASKRMLQAMIDASRVLTPQQRQTLADTMKQRHDLMDRHQRERRALEAPKS